MPDRRSSIPRDPAPPELLAILEDARGHFAAGRIRDAAAALCTAEATARQKERHREAAQLRQAIGILQQGGKPKLFFRGF